MTDAKIVSLKGEEIIPRGTARPDVVAALEEMLEMAKSGEIDGIAAALLLHDDCTTFRLNGRVNRALIGVIRMMEFRLLYDDLRESE